MISGYVILRYSNGNKKIYEVENKHGSALEIFAVFKQLLYDMTYIISRKRRLKL